jgi:hypothetical protein
MLQFIGSVIALVCGIAVLIRLFQKEGVLKGILGIICMLYTYIWGWMHVKEEELNIKTWMWVWTGAIILGIILNLVGQAQASAYEDILDALQ